MSEKNRVMTQGRREIRVGILLLSNDENNVIAKNVLSLFYCSSSKLRKRLYILGLNNNY